MNKIISELRPGSKVGAWTLAAVFTHTNGTRRWRRWNCTCICGTRRAIFEHTLRAHRTLSCGCETGARIAMAKTRHGEAGQHRTREYRIWANIRTRCTNTNNEAYPDYGGRGITVCARWETFENFLADMGRCPPDHTIERVDNDGPYSPGNCVWATRKEQANNTRRSRLLTFKGKTQSLQAWADELGRPRQSIQSRLRLGWTEEKTLGTP